MSGKLAINMAADIYRAHYEFVFGSLTQEQFEFIEDNVYCSDDGTYELSKENQEKLKHLYRDRPDLTVLFNSFDKEIEKGKGHFSFRIFI
jgi:hypothetical protein